MYEIDTYQGHTGSSGVAGDAHPTRDDHAHGKEWTSRDTGSQVRKSGSSTVGACYVFFASLIPATFLLVLGYFVLFASARAEGGIRTFGRILAVWIFLIALLPPIGGAVVTVSGGCPMQKIFERGVESPTGLP